MREFSREPTIAEQVGMAWYNGLTSEQRRYWHEVANSPRPCDAFRAYSSDEEGKAMLHPNKDYYGWTVETAKLLRQGKFAAIDIEALIEEVEDMGKSEKRELKSRLTSLLMHLLKWQYQPDRRGRSWNLTIKNQRREVLDELADNPSLKPKLAEIEQRAYPVALTQAALETDQDEAIFPATFEATGWTWEQVLDSAFYPD